MRNIRMGQLKPRSTGNAYGARQCEHARGSRPRAFVTEATVAVHTKDYSDHSQSRERREEAAGRISESVTTPQNGSPSQEVAEQASGTGSLDR